MSPAAQATRRPGPADAALWAAVLGGDLAGAGVALSQGADPNRRRGTKCMLARALELRDSAMARLLLEAGASALGAAHGTSLLALALNRGFVDLLEPLAKAGADLAGECIDGYTPAGVAARRHDAALLRELARLGAPLDRARIRGLSPVAGPDHTLATWCGSLPRKDVPQAAWDQLEVLLGLAVDEEAAAALGEAVARTEEAIGRAVCERVSGSDWGGTAFFLVLHLELLYAGHTDWAREVRRAHAVDVARPNPWGGGPWVTTPLAAALHHARQEAGKPRRLKRVVNLVRELLAAGADPHARQYACPLVFWAAAWKIPWVALEPLLQAGVDPLARLVVDVPEAPDSGRVALDAAWQGATLAHLMASCADHPGLRGLLARAPQAVAVRDRDGLTPLLRAVIPADIGMGSARSHALWPTLELLLGAGADADARTHRGNTLAHLLALACEHRVVPKDIGEVLAGMGAWAPGWLDHANAQGQTGWDCLAARAEFLQHPAFQALARQRALDQALGGGGPAARRGGRL